MTRPVAILPEVLANQIAAGEVVERPASVVKELVENALDAEATRIFVDIADGGRDLIRVVDNGIGMNPADAALAVRRHATSKIQTSTDLSAIDTLGFRGEALPSIASVSHFRLATRTADSISGTQVVIDGGRQPVISDVGTGVGTRIEVSDLFFNVPARLKFLKRRATEAGHITTLMTAFSLGHPHVHFKLTADGKTTLEHPVASRLEQRIFAVLGRGTAARVHEVRHEGRIRIRGYISEPGHNRTNQGGIHTFVNGRRVRDRTINHALISAYGPLLERGRFPYAVLYLHVAADELDVNVHPTKAEVRFTHAGAVHDAIVRACKVTLVAAPWKHLAGLAPSAVAETQRRYQPGWRPLPTGGLARSSHASPRQELRFTERVTAVPGPDTAEPRLQIASPGLIRGRYLLTEDEVGVRIIDIQVANRRLTEFRLATALRGDTSLDAKPLLMPLQVELDAPACSALCHHGDHLARLGIQLEPFGGPTWQLRAVPTDFVNSDLHALVRIAAATFAGAPHGTLSPNNVARVARELSALAPPPTTGSHLDELLSGLVAAEIDLDDVALTVSFQALSEHFS